MDGSTNTKKKEKVVIKKKTKLYDDKSTIEDKDI